MKDIGGERAKLIEEVAKALCDEEWDGTQPWDRKPKGFRDRYRRRAAVAIQTAYQFILVRQLHTGDILTVMDVIAP